MDKEGEGSGEGRWESVEMKEGEEGERRRVESDSREDEGVEGGTEEEGGEKEKGGGGEGEETEKDRQPGQNVGEEEEGKEEDGGNGINIGPIPRMICQVLETADVRCTHVHVRTCSLNSQSSLLTHHKLEVVVILKYIIHLALQWHCMYMYVYIHVHVHCACTCT